MSYFVIALVFWSIAIIMATMIILVAIKGKIKQAIYTETFWWFVCLIVICTFFAGYTFSYYKQYIETNAIDHYIVGDVECVEKLDSSGEVIDWYYKVIPVDYE